MKQYRELLIKVLAEGKRRNNRTGVDTLSIFGEQAKFDLYSGFPLLTTKKIHFKSVVHELLWFISGSTNVQYLQDNGVKIWDKWADAGGNLGPVYGAQWRKWLGPGDDPIDQLLEVIREIKRNPDSRRLIVTAWNPGEIDEMALPPCHCFFQFNVNEGKLDCQMYQRSADLFLGVPFNIASYALLTHLVAHVCDLQAGVFTHTFGDLHLYVNHLNQAKEQLQRDCRGLPSLYLSPQIKGIDDFGSENITLYNYNPHPAIKAEVAV